MKQPCIKKCAEAIAIIALVAFTLLLSQLVFAQVPALDSKDRNYIAQVVAANATKTNAQLLDLHVKAVREATSADMTDEEAHETYFGVRVSHTIVIGEAEGKRYEFLTSANRTSKLIVGNSYPVAPGLTHIGAWDKNYFPGYKQADWQAKSGAHKLFLCTKCTAAASARGGNDCLERRLEFPKSHLLCFSHDQKFICVGPAFPSPPARLVAHRLLS